MNIEITEDRSRYKTTDYTWNVRIDGMLVAVAKTPGAGDYVALEVQARNDAAKLKQALSALEAVDAAITAELAHTYDDAPCPCPCDMCGETITEEGMRYCRTCREADDAPRCPCGQPALFFVQYPGQTYAYCPDCYRELNAGRPPLLAQCADVIRRCLGRTTGAGSIIDELRRVERALSREGW